MRWTRKLRLRLRSLLRRSRVEQEIDEELRYHLDRQTDAFIAGGMDPVEARYAALREMGGIEQRREQCRDSLGLRLLDELLHDVGYAVRTLANKPGFTSVAVLTLALGSGANAAIFSIFNQALLRPLPVPAPDHLVNLSSPGPRPGRTSTSGTFRPDDVFSYPLFRDLEREQRVFTGIAAHRDFAAHVSYESQPSNEEGRLVSGSYFPVLAIQPALGRLLGPEDDRTRAAHPVVALSHRDCGRRQERAIQPIEERAAATVLPAASAERDGGQAQLLCQIDRTGRAAQFVASGRSPADRSNIASREPAHAGRSGR
jgi:MacB-like periplasmic core domain